MLMYVCKYVFIYVMSYRWLSFVTMGQANPGWSILRYTFTKLRRLDGYVCMYNSGGMLGVESGLLHSVFVAMMGEMISKLNGDRSSLGQRNYSQPRWPARWCRFQIPWLRRTGTASRRRLIREFVYKPDPIRVIYIAFFQRSSVRTDERALMYYGWGWSRGLRPTGTASSCSSWEYLLLVENCTGC
jgi:hypothetical protein